MVYVKCFLPSKQTASLYIIIILHQTATGWYSSSIHAPVGGATTASLSKANKQIDTALFLRCGQICNGVLAFLNLFVVLIVWNLDVAICVLLSAVL